MRKPVQTDEKLHFLGSAKEALCYDGAMKLRSSSCGQERVGHTDPVCEKNLAIAILRQAWHEAVIDLRGVKEASRKDYRALKRKAIEWIASDEEGFPYWCRLADVDHRAMRQKLDFALRQQRRARRN